MSLPVTASTSTNLIIGSGHVVDASVGRYGAIVELASTTTVWFYRVDANATDHIGKDPNFAITTPDVVVFSCSYEAA